MVGRHVETAECHAVKFNVEQSFFAGVFPEVAEVADIDAAGVVPIMGFKVEFGATEGEIKPRGV